MRVYFVVMTNRLVRRAVDLCSTVRHLAAACIWLMSSPALAALAVTLGWRYGSCGVTAVAKVCLKVSFSAVGINGVKPSRAVALAALTSSRR